MSGGAGILDQAQGKAYSGDGRVLARLEFEFKKYPVPLVSILAIVVLVIPPLARASAPPNNNRIATSEQMNFIINADPS